jgi:hypothetical protein
MAQRRCSPRPDLFVRDGPIKFAADHEYTLPYCINWKKALDFCPRGQSRATVMAGKKEAKEAVRAILRTT